MGKRRAERGSGRATKDEARVPPPAFDGQGAERNAQLMRARDLLTEQALPAIDDFRDYMAEQNRKLEVASYLDHIEGPQIVIHISRADGRITATLIAEVTPAGIRPSWDVQSTGRFNTRWTEPVRSGVDGLTRESMLAKLIELYHTDFS
jgi:hypothetical protein